MRKVTRLTERDLTRIVSKVISEQQHEEITTPKDHPINNPLYKKFDDEITGEGVKTLSSSPNQVVVDGLSGIWTLTWKRR